MSAVQDILKGKGSHVYSVGSDTMVADAAIVMNNHHIGALVIVDDDRVCGIFTERDILRRVVAVRRDPDQVTVAEVMTRDVVYCRANTKIAEARSVFKNRRIRHLPVVEGNQKIIGMISIGDLNALQAYEQESTIHYLHEYLYGVA